MSPLVDMRPRLESPASVRRFLAVAAMASVVLLIYASLVPLNFRPLSWESTWQAWHQIPWLHLDVFHRADWVANALVVLPAGILAAAAVDWGRQNSWPLLLASPFITFFLTLVVIAIELAQVWFPPRTVSLNDIAAGFVGAALGPTLWAIGGPTVEKGIANFLTLPRVRDRFAWLCMGWMCGLVIYNLLPLDVILSRIEWQEKVAAGRVQWNSLFNGIDWRTGTIELVLAALSFAPLGFLCAIVASPRWSRWALWVLPIAVQLIQLPLFTKSFSTPAILGGWIGGWLAYWLGQRLDRLAMLINRPLVWALAWIFALGFALQDLLRGHARVLADSHENAVRFANAWSWPLVKYYAKSEYGALASMLEQLLVFAAIGACGAAWAQSVSLNRNKLVIWTSLLTATVLAFGIELVQICLPPLVPDMSDAIVYLTGYAAGYFLIFIVLAPATYFGTLISPSEQFPEDSVADLGMTLATPQVRESRQRTLWLLGGITLMAIAGYGSLVPLNYSPRDLSDVWAEFLRSGSNGADLTSVDWGVNVMLLIPASFCFVAAAFHGNSSFGYRVAWSAVVLIGCVSFSVLIEIAQSWFPPRVPTLIDVAAQACGALIGIVAWWICGPALSNVLAEIEVDDTSQNRLGLILLAYVVGLLFFSLAPLDLTLHPLDLADKYRAGRILLIPFSYRADSNWQFVYDSIADVAVFVPVGVFATTFLASRGHTDRSIAHGLLLGCTIVVGIEVMQLFVMSRYTDATDLINGSLGVAIGVFGYRYLRGTSSVHVRDVNLRNWWLALCLTLYSLILGVIFWFPFDFDLSDTESARTRMSKFFGVPFSRAEQGSYLAAQDGILRKLLLFVPVGAMIAIIFARLRQEVRAFSLLIAFCLTAGLAVGLELGQIFLPGRFAGFDDALVCMLGALIGYWAAKRFAG